MPAYLRVSLCLAVASLLSAATPLPADDALSTVVITPAGSSSQASSSENVPLVVPAPAAAKRSSKTAEVAADESAAGAPPQPPSASESASRRAREEWQKQLTAAGQQKKQQKKAEQPKPTKGRKPKANTTSTPAGSKAMKSQPAKTLPEVVPQPVRLPRYVDVYRSIPFSRALFDADPSYRHNATMELLLNQLRPASSHVDTNINVTVRAIEPYRSSHSLRGGYRAWSRYPWH